MLKLRVFFRPVFLSRAYRTSTERSLRDAEDGDDTAPLRHREVVKDVYEESETTASRSADEIEDFRKKHNVTIKGDAPNPVLTMDEIKLPEKMSKLFAGRGLRTPTPIQSLCWPLALKGKDLIGVAQTGSGKTLGYLVPSALHIVRQPNVGHPGPTALVLAPTRELVQQIASVSADWLLPSMRIRHVPVYGGASRLVQMNDMRRGFDICVATPGRLLDFIQGREVSLSNTSFLVLDEADRMLDMGFEPQIRDIIESMRPDRQTLMFSATWPQDVRSLARDFMSADATRINIGSTELCANDNITQELQFVSNEDQKTDLLFNILEQNSRDKILIFAATQRRVTHLAMKIIRNGFRCVESHGGLSLAKRERALQLFKGHCNIMVATDVAARGLDVQNIKVVVNYDFPQTIEDYVHRIGRTGRVEAKGRAFTFFSPENASFAKALAGVLTRSGHEIPDKLVEYIDNNAPSPSFRRNFVKKPTNFRMSRASDWRRDSRSFRPY
ncbi:ATP-dependent RNA helicase p62 [Galendromus occidentalis]|uniref:RNA helicase n=1 Tax=Galendromus occidentalis TaxID=34638 RepID=A0AAJ6VYR3_9ACAR|nr:ATP-dependent RNA helicase p62 [Galendromus occidentalis]